MQRGFVGILVLVVVLIAASVGGYFVYNNLTENARTQKEINESLKVRQTQTPSPTSNPSDETANPDLIGANWKTYKNIEYGFELQHPSNSTIEISMQGGVSPNLYIRIQNYTEKEVLANQGRLVAGQYYLEIYIYDKNLGHKSSRTCPGELINPRKIDLGVDVTAYRSTGSAAGGDSATYIYSLCANKRKVDYYIQASENFDTVASKIIDSFKFTD